MAAKPQLSDTEKVRKSLGHFASGWVPREFLNTTIPELNAIFGYQDRGLVYGKIIEVSGWESQGKTVCALALAAMAQRDGAYVLWADFENSFDAAWAQQRGVKLEMDDAGRVLDSENFGLVYPFIGMFPNEKDERMSTAEELCAETEAIIRMKAKKYNKIMLVIDSIAAMVPEEAMEAGIEDQTMRSETMSLASFLSGLFRRWVGLFQACNVLVVATNQLRSKPNPYDPVYTPGGNAFRFYCHARARIRRTKGGIYKDKTGEMAGIQGILENKKSKFGYEGAKIGFKMPKGVGPMQFLPAEDLEREK